MNHLFIKLGVPFAGFNGGSTLYVMDETNHWVASRLSDGLGNRLFQLAAAHKASKRWSLPLVFAMPYCRPAAHGSFKSIFNMFPDIPKLWKAEPLINIDQDPGTVFTYNPLPETAITDSILLRGSWIAANYVDPEFRPSWSSAVSDGDVLLARHGLGSLEDRAKTVFLHIRLGDYLILPHHQVNLLPFYARAMASFPEDSRFLIFSDEPEKVQVMPGWTMVQEPDEVRALFLMAHCSLGAITANSTFSWWGAFFGRQIAGDQHLTIMPSKWMASGENTTDVYPPWAKILNC